jgi:alpha-maltose-1-phosphate synthase
LIALSHPTGNRNVRAALKALVGRNSLHSFWTGFCWQGGSPVWLPETLGAQLRRRSFEGIPQNLIRQNPWRELARLAVGQTPFIKHFSHRLPIADNTRLYLEHDRFVAKRLPLERDVDGLYAYWGGARESFHGCTRRGSRKILEIPTLYWDSWQTILESEADRHPEWAPTLRGGRVVGANSERFDEELESADAVIVPSDNVLKSLPAWFTGRNRVRVIPYGCPPASAAGTSLPNRSERLRVLYVGSLGQAKGLGYLFRAVRELRGLVELTLVGRKVANDCPVLDRALNEHKWIASLPNQQVLSLMRESDLLVHPSLLEGMALVVGEALSQGLPVIVTPMAGWGGLVQDGVNGYVVETGNWEQIADRLSFLAKNRDFLELLAKNAWKTAVNNSEAIYGDKLCQILG